MSYLHATAVARQNRTGRCLSGSIFFPGEPTDTDAATRVASADQLGYSLIPVRDFIQLAASLAVNPSAGDLTIIERAFPQVENDMLDTTANLPANFDRSMSHFMYGPSMLDVSVVNSAVVDSGCNIYVLQQRMPYVTQTAVPLAGAADPMSVAQELFAMFQPTQPATTGPTTVPSVYEPGRSFLGAPRFGEYFRVVSRAHVSSLAHGATATRRLRLPGVSYCPAVDLPKAPSGTVGGAAYPIIPYKQFYVVIVGFSRGVGVMTTTAGTGAAPVIGASPVSLVYSLRWSERIRQSAPTRSLQWTDWSPRTGAGTVVAGLAAGGAAATPHAMNRFGTAAANTSGVAP